MVVPVTLAAEMVQDYHISEVGWLFEKLPEDEYIKVFKPYEELKKAIQDLEDRGIKKVPYVMPHTDATFVKDQCPPRLQVFVDDGYDVPFISDNEIVAYIQEFKADDISRKIKAKLYLKTASNDQDYLNFIADVESGKVINVSIGFICDWAGAGVFNGQPYTLTQTNIQIGHLAGLVNARGKCPAGICGINQDHHIDINHEHTHVANMGNIYCGFTDENKIGTEQTCDCAKKTKDKSDEDVVVQDNRLLNNSHVNQTQEDILMTPEEEAAKKKAEEEKEKMKKESKDSTEILIQSNHDLTLKLGIAEQTIADLRKEVQDLKKENDSFKEIKRSELIEFLGKDRVINGKKIADTCLHDLSVMADFKRDMQDKELENKGLPMPSADERKNKLNPNGDSSKLKHTGMITSLEDEK